MVPSYRLVLYRTIDPLGSPLWTPPFPPNFVFYIVKKDFSPFRMIKYQLLSVRQVLWRVSYTWPNLPLAERLVIRGLLSWVIVILYPMVDTRIFLTHTLTHTFKLLIFMSIDFIVCLDHSWYTPGQIAQSVVYRLYDPKIVGSILDSTQKYFSLRKCQK